MARSSYYYHQQRTTLNDKYKEIKDNIQDIYASHKGRFGYRRIAQELKNKGFLINHKTVARLMKELGLKSIIRIKKYKSYKGEFGRIAPNILNRNFRSSSPNQKCATDITEFNLSGEKLYLSPVIDLYNGEIISYELSARASFKQVKDMLQKSFRKLTKQDRSLILHSDQGWQYQMRQYQEILKGKGIRQSMSRKGNCLDNAVIESFFSTIKAELFYLKKFTSIDHLKKEIKEYIVYYNNKRIKLGLNGMSPVQYRAHNCQY
jgi:putative transposase